MEAEHEAEGRYNMTVLMGTMGHGLRVTKRSLSVTPRCARLRGYQATAVVWGNNRPLKSITHPQHPQGPQQQSFPGTVRPNLDIVSALLPLSCLFPTRGMLRFDSAGLQEGCTWLLGHAKTPDAKLPLCCATTTTETSSRLSRLWRD